MKKLLNYISAASAALLLASCSGSVDPFGPDPGEGTASVIISEVDGSDDMIELFNDGTTELSLAGFKLRRMRLKDGVDDEQTLWTGQPSETLAPGAYLALTYEPGIENNVSHPHSLQNQFSSHKNTLIWLQDQQGAELSRFTRGVKSVGWGQVGMQKVEDAEDNHFSYSYVSGQWVYAKPTPGAANAVSAGSIDQTMFGVVLNEIDMSASTLELYNITDKPIELKGFQIRWSRLKGGEGDNQTIWEPTVSTVIQPRSFLTAKSRIIMTSFADRNFHLKLRDPAHSDFTGSKHAWDDVKRGTKGEGWTSVSLGSSCLHMARIPDGTGSWYVVSKPTPGASNGTDMGGGLVPDMDQE